MRNVLFLGAATAALVPAAAWAQQTSAVVPDDRNQIVVTATPFATAADDTPSIVAKVDRETIRTTGGASIADSLANVPGISATDFASGASRPIIRGQDANRVRLLEDGVSSFDVSDIGPDHGIPIDPLAAQSIEVVRGAATLRYGSQAIGGVVNVLNNRVPTALPDKPLSGEIDGSYGTVSDVGEASILADAKVGDFALHGDAFERHADDYDTPLGRQQNSYFRGNGGSVGGSWISGDTHLGAAYTRYDANYGIPSDTTHIVMHQNKFLTRDTIAIDSGVLKELDVYGGYADYQHQEVEPTGEVDSTFRNKEGDGRAELLLNPIGPFANTAIGTEVQRRRFSALGEDSSYLFPTLTQSEAGYIFTEAPLAPALKLQAAGRVEHTRVNGTPAGLDDRVHTDFTPVSGSIGALLTATQGVKLGLTFSSTGRAPAQTELFARGGHDGPDTFETGDPNLKIERANSLEGSFRLNTGKLHFDGSVYYTWFRNYIFGDLTGRTCDDDGNCVDGDDGDLRELNYRQGGTRFRGVEGEASYELFRTGSGGTLSAKALADYTRATLNSGGNVPRIPPYRAGGGLTYASKSLDVSALYLYVGRQNKFGAFDTPTPHYNQLNAQIAVRPFVAYPGIELAVVGQNLTNDVQRAATALNKDEVVLPGRNVRIAIRFATF
jgi:iron complex outermembrane receptor protein